MITLIAAMDRNNLIGNGDALPWHLPADLRHFKQTTLDKPIIMGRTTYEGLPIRPLPRRTNIIISTTLAPDEGKVFPSIEAGIEFATTLSNEVFIIGGQSIYEQTIEMADRLLITHVRGDYEGTHYFPHIGEIWTPVSLIETGDIYTIVDYRKK